MILPFWRLEICKGSQWTKSKIQAVLRSFLGAPEDSRLSCLFQFLQAVFLGSRLPEHFHSEQWPVECLAHCVTVPLPSCFPSPFKDPMITVVSPVYPTIQSSQCQPINHLNIMSPDACLPWNITYPGFLGIGFWLLWKPLFCLPHTYVSILGEFLKDTVYLLINLCLLLSGILNLLSKFRSCAYFDKFNI